MTSPMSTRSMIEVRGMTCGNCVKHVESALRGVAGVTSAEVTLASGEAVVTHDAAQAPVAALVAAIKEEGYEAAVRESK